MQLLINLHLVRGFRNGAAVLDDTEGEGCEILHQLVTIGIPIKHCKSYYVYIYNYNWLVVYLPLWKILVSWDDYSKYMESHKLI